MQNLGESLYRYNTLQEHNYTNEAQAYAKSHKVTIEEAIADSEKDYAANSLGRERGRKYPYCDCSILMHDLLPEYKK